MSFLHLWAITIGAAGLAVPLLVHLLTKPRPTRIPFSTINFVLEVVKQRRARNRLRDLIILLLRMAAVALFAMVIARPLMGEAARLAASDHKADIVKIVLLDVSQSMAATSQGIETIARARPVAARHVAYHSGTQTNLILSGANPVAVFDRPSTNFSTLVDEVGRSRPLPERLQAQAALNRATEMFSKVGDEKTRRVLVIVSDFQRTNWATVDFSVLPMQTEIQLESVGAPQTPPNLALLRVGCQGRIEAGRPFRLEVDVGNYSPTPRKVTAEVVIGEALFRLEGQCTAGNRSTLVTEVTLPTPGWHAGTARLVGVEDGLHDDNTRPVVLRAHPQPTYLLLTRQSPSSRSSSSYFLERALAPAVSKNQSQERIVRADPGRVETDLLSSANLLILDHPGKLAEDRLELLAALMRRGRGILYVAAEPIDATNLNLLAKAAGTNLQLPVEFVPPSPGQVRKNLFLTNIQRKLPPFTVFGDEASAILAPVRFAGGLNSRRVEGALLDDVLATYNDQSAGLLVTACGSGTLAVLNTDLGSSNLPASPAFVPLIGELSSELLGLDRSPEALASGEPIAAYLPASAGPVANLRIEHPREVNLESTTLGELHEESVGVLWQAPAAGPPGVYSVKRGSETVFALASAISPDEADLVGLAPDVMTDRLAGGRDVKFHSVLKDDEPRDQLWSWLAIACLLCLVTEVVSLRVFKS